MPSVYDFDYEKVKLIKNQKRPMGNQGNRYNKQINYKNLVCAFDIETSKVPFTPYSIMYAWRFAFDEWDIIRGTKWDEFRYFVEKLSEVLEETTIVVYVHNLSFEFQFLAGVFEFDSKNVFAVKSRKVLKCNINKNIELRCSYLLTHCNLENFTRNMKVKHVKLSGNLDHEVYRTPDTPISEDENNYMDNDVIGLVEALKVKMKKDGDNLYTIPLTSTGYIRRMAKKALRQVNHNYVKSQIVDYNIYCMLREAFRGGNTHANRYFSGSVLRDVKSTDISSSYPAVQINCDFPVEKFVKINDISTSHVIELIYKRQRPILARVKFENIRLRNKFWGSPYLTKDKSRKLPNNKTCWIDKNNYVSYDNGRILESSYLETTLTDVDYKIIADEYEWDNCQFLEVYASRYGKLPESYKAMIIKLYKDKTELKNVETEEYNYMRSKELINSIYGMSAQNPLNRNIIFTDFLYFEEDNTDGEILYNEYLNKIPFLPYQWGVWTTALARYKLEEGLKIVGDDFIYCDTDSIKYIGEHDFNTLNNDRKEISMSNGAVAYDIYGKAHVIGLFETEKTYYKFKTLGAKKYIYQYEDEKTHVTIAGVSKLLGGQELDSHATENHKNKGMDVFEPGFVFEKAGGTESCYFDYIPCNDKIIYINGKDFEVTRCVSIEKSTYAVGITIEYAELLKMCGEDNIRNVWERYKKDTGR